MSELATLARPYAVAAYKRAKETGATDKWSKTLSFLAALMGDELISAAASNPKASRGQFTRGFLDLCEGHLDTESENFVRLLVSNRRLNLLKQISEQFENYRAEEEGYVAVSVRSAYAVDDGQRTQMESILTKTLGKTPRLDVTVDESLIGGVLIKAGDRVIDASVRGQIQRLAKILN